MAERAPPALPDELVEEILLRVPPDEPARLMRAALACKPWCRLVCGPAFRRRFRERHRTLPAMGIVRNFLDEHCRATARFLPTCGFRPRRADRRGWHAIDSRHGRVLVHRYGDLGRLGLWYPIADRLWELPALPLCPCEYQWNAVVLCAAAADGCDHLDCGGRPFLVVAVGTVPKEGMFAYVYSSKSGSWGEPTFGPDPGVIFQRQAAALAGNALYFGLMLNGDDGNDGDRLLRYDMSTREITVIQAPPVEPGYPIVLMTVSGALRAIKMEGYKLYFWSREAGLDGDIGWTLSEVVELNALIPAGADLDCYKVVGFADGGGVVSLWTDQGTFTEDLKFGQVKKLGGLTKADNILPYMSFHTPVTERWPLQVRVQELVHQVHD
ncbi:hypothetical protein ACP4OV_012255 [Aristida adscensionis]